MQGGVYSFLSYNVKTGHSICKQVTFTWIVTQGLLTPVVDIKLVTSLPEPCHETTCLLDSRLGKTQTRLCSHRGWLQA